MRLRQIFDILQNTELKQIVVGEDDKQVIALMNLGLIEIYGKFNILQEEQTIRIIDGVTRYSLVDNSQKVLQVFCRNVGKDPLRGEDAFEEVPLNDINDDNSVYTSQPFLLHVPNPDEGKIYSVIQVVTPPYITKDNIDTVDINFPPQYLDPLVNYIAFRAYKSMNGDEQTEIGSHWRAYMMSCDEVYKKGLAQYSVLTNIKLNDRGFR